LNNLRIDHNAFRNFGDTTIIMLGEVSTNAKFFGSIDNNTFSGPNNSMILKILSTGNPSSWASSVRGTASNLYVEDNVLDFDSGANLGSGCLDAWNSAAVVFRYNTTRNCLLTAHGVVHGGGTVNFEAYGNTLERRGGDSTWQNGTRLIHHQGSGEITVWGNVFKHSVSPIGGALAVTHYRSATPSTAGYSSSLGQCDGTRSIDGNTGSRGYPCWLQPGRAPAGGNPAYGVLSPMYSWQNVDYSTGAKVPMTVEDPWDSGYVSVHIQANRDYFDAVSNAAQTSRTSPFNGASGMGFGTVANRPATCTTGTAYWATDEGEWNSRNAGADGRLYKCSSTNNWTVAYTPYPYPHPLQAGGTGGGVTPPQPPTNLQTTVTD
jgi:hypothetical protein